MGASTNSDEQELSPLGSTVFWLDRLRDAPARSRILARRDRAAGGEFCDASAVGESVAELRVDYGPGYRVYFARRQRAIVILLIGGEKSTQEKDIKRAIQLARDLEEQMFWPRRKRIDTTRPSTSAHPRRWHSTSRVAWRKPTVTQFSSLRLSGTLRRPRACHRLREMQACPERASPRHFPEI